MYDDAADVEILASTSCEISNAYAMQVLGILGKPASFPLCLNVGMSWWAKKHVHMPDHGV
ncbi:predicted protein [Botrytis cinerea T4]|uniref:Uncharacterized protein n=1 Tax=Botryotinia fuckeliana (strain T4) TaxID=999810 RepID=G2XUS6_BOTF4|nr:predicted protein [Botrytis cinerea T4]